MMPERALAAARMGTFDWDVPRNRITWSRGHEALWGFNLGEFDGDYASLALRIHPDDLPGVKAEMARCIAADKPFTREFRVVWPDGSDRWMEGVAEFTFDDGGQPVRLRGVVLEITERKQADQRIQNLNRIYGVLSAINQTIVREKNPQAMLESACRTAVEKGLFRMAWIGFLDSHINQVNVAAQAGETGDYLERINIILDDEARGHGPTAEALRTGSHVVCNDIEHDSRMIPWREDASRMGFRACASFPLMVEDKAIGTFTLYAGTAGFFDAEELRLLDHLALDISFALETSQIETERRKAEEELRWKTAFFEAQVDSAPDGIWVEDREGKKILQNQRLNEVWKIPPYLADGKDDAAQLQFQASRTKNPQTYLAKILYLYSHPNETSRDIIELVDGTVLDRCSSPVRDKAGRYFGRIWAFRDVTRNDDYSGGSRP